MGKVPVKFWWNEISFRLSVTSVCRMSGQKKKTITHTHTHTHTLTYTLEILQFHCAGESWVQVNLQGTRGSCEWRESDINSPSKSVICAALGEWVCGGEIVVRMWVCVCTSMCVLVYVCRWVWENRKKSLIIDILSARGDRNNSYWDN